MCGGNYILCAFWIQGVAFIKHRVAEYETDPTVVIQIRGLVKSYPGNVTIGCYEFSQSPPYHAVEELWLNLPNNQLFCLLGPMELEKLL